MVNYPHMYKTLTKIAFYFNFWFFGFRLAEGAIFGDVL